MHAFIHIYTYSIRPSSNLVTFLGEQSSLFGDQWFFLTDRMQIKLVSTPPRPLTSSDDFDPEASCPEGSEHPCT